MTAELILIANPLPSHKPRVVTLFERELVNTELSWGRLKRDVDDVTHIEDYTRHLRRCDRLKNSMRRRGL